MLGCSGKVLADATKELHQTLQELGCRAFYFKHTYDEVSESIEAILRCYENAQPMFRETQEAISRGEVTVAEMYRLKAELDVALYERLKLTEHSAGYGQRQADEHQIDESAFKDYLNRRGSWGRKDSLAAERDVSSLALILRLRGSGSVRDVAKAGFIFVTHNVKLTLMAKDFLREERQLPEGSVWPFMTVGQLSTISWVANESFNNDSKGYQRTHR